MSRLFELFLGADPDVQVAVLLVLGLLVAGIGITAIAVTWLIVGH